jgi:hypothetical protein
MCLVEGLKLVWDGLDLVLGVFGWGIRGWVHPLGTFPLDAGQPSSTESSGRG